LQLLLVPVEGDAMEAPRMPDALARYYAQGRAAHSRYVLCAAKLIAPVVDDDFEKGYQWLISSLKAPRPGAAADHDGWLRGWVVPTPC
jgi:hypothetical protein